MITFPSPVLCNTCDIFFEKKLTFAHPKEEPTFKSNSATNTINKTNEEEFVRTEKQFNWSYSFPQVLSLVVVDNEEDEKLAHIVPNGFILELPENRFPNGLYYYKLIDEEGDLVEIGSFYVFRY